MSNSLAHRSVFVRQRRCVSQPRVAQLPWVYCSPLVLVLCAGLAWQARPTVAKEPAAEFLQALRDAGYHDAALDYLEQLQTSRLAPAQFQETRLYELGVTLVQASRTQRDLAIRERQLEQARTAFESFLSSQPSQALTPAAKLQLGSVLVERGRIKVEQAKPSRLDQATLKADARKLYDEAYQVFVRSQEELRDKLAKLKTVAPDSKHESELRDRLRADFVQAQLLAAAIKEETADTVEQHSADYESLLATAANAYGQLYEKHHTRLAGLYGRLYQARCQLKLNKIQESLSLLSELLDQPDSPDEILRLKAEAFVLAAEGWAKSRPPLYAEAVSRLGPFLEATPRHEGRQEVWLKLRLELAKAQWAVAQDLKGRDSQNTQASKLEHDARQHVLGLSQQAGECQREARQLLASWGGPSPNSQQKPQLPTFAEAKRAGLEALEALQTAQLVVSTVPARIAAETDAAIKADLQTQLDEAQQTVDTAVVEARPYFRRAVTLAGRETNVPVDELNSVRYFLCFLHYTSGEYLEAATLGEFVARRYPHSPPARECAKIALASHGKLYNEAKSEDRTFEVARLTELAGYITKQWAGQPEAGEALGMLIPLLIREGQLDVAESYLQAAPPDSPQRADTELRMGQALWGAYRKGMQELRQWAADPAAVPAGTDTVAKQAALQQLRTRAQGILAERVTRMQQSGTVNASAATAALSLAQIYLDTGQVDRAVTLLEDATVGPLTLVTQGHAAAKREGFAGETYKTTLRAYISSLPEAADSDAVVAKAIRVMDVLQTTIDADKLVTIYVGLAHDLEEQMKLATPERKKSLSRGFEAFLIRIRSGATDFSVLNWVAETFVSLGSSFYDADQKLTPEAKQYYDEAADTYETILKKVPLDNPERKVQVLLHHALTQRRLHNFLEAKRIYLELLREHAALRNVQMEAARMYQEWAAFPDKSPLYERAIRGAEPDAKTGTNVIWGWAYLANVAARQPKSRETFHEARYNLAMCRYHWGLAQKTKTERDVLFEKAKQDILRTRELYGTGPEWESWKPRYDALMKKIQED